MSELKYPKPQPTKTYYEVIEEGLKKFPKRAENYEKYKQSKKGEVVDYLPIKLDIENVSRCNLLCDMCIVKNFDNQKRAEDLSLEDFKEIIDEQYGIYEIKLQGIGEPLLQKEYIEMVRYAAKEKNIWVRTTTNATILDVNENYKKVIDAGVGEIQVSIDGTTKETYENIRKKAKFERVVNNCKLINGYCNSLNTEKTRMWTLLQESNFHELYSFPQFAKDLGFNRLTISMDIYDVDKEEKYNEEKNVTDKITQKDIDELLAIAKKIDLDLTFWIISGKYTRENPCAWPFERAYISSDKKVLPCCLICSPDIFNFGELGDFENIWNSEQYRSFRRLHLTGKVPKICRDCYDLEK